MVFDGLCEKSGFIEDLAITSGFPLIVGCEEDECGVVCEGALSRCIPSSLIQREIKFSGLVHVRTLIPATHSGVVER